MMMRLILLFFFSLSPLYADTTIHALRLKPGEDLRKELEALVVREKIQAGSVISAVGSLKEAAIRFANKPNPTILKGNFEVVSLSGTLGLAGNHLHLAVSDGEGKTVGGHLGDGSKVFTTLEIVIGIYSDLKFLRVQDKMTGFKELEIKTIR
jgi:predicted DNA-binding protein with PD1-like motif